MKAVTIFFMCLIGCLASSRIWEVFVPPKASSSSRFYVIHDWKVADGVYSNDATDAFPAERVSDVMLKTLGILREGVSWDGVNLGSLFKRPTATALFLVDGLSHDIEIKPLSESSFPVDQSGLPGNSLKDTEVMFSGDNVLQHMQGLFGEKSVTQFVSGDKELSSMLSPEHNSLSSEKPSSEEVFRLSNDNNFDPNCEIIASFISELLIIQSSVEKLSKSAVTDGVPDVLVFSFTTVRALEAKYGANSAELSTALQMVQGMIKEVSDGLVNLYQGNIVVQALVLQWKYEPLSEEHIELIGRVLDDHMFSDSEVKDILKSLPLIDLPNTDSYVRSSVCADLAYVLELENVEFDAECMKGRSMLRRSVEADEYSYLEDTANNTIRYDTPSGVVEQRSDEYPAIFLIIFVTVVPLALALFAISWAMWNMDPGRDSVIYRNTDNIPGINPY